MKPVIIYSMQRTRSSAVLYSCIRTQRLYEPFGIDTIFDGHWRAHSLFPTFNKYVSDLDWTSLIEKMNDPNSVTKIFGYHIWKSKNGRKWFESAIKDNTHDIFVLERDWMEIGLSSCLARITGYDIDHEKKDFQFQ